MSDLDAPLGKYKPQRMSLEYSVYRDELRPLKYGLPIYEPNPSGYDRVRIGDVGLVTKEGYFETFFTVFFPSDHWVNQRFGVPDGFEKADDNFKMWRNLNEIPAGCWIRSKSIRDIGANLDFSAYVVVMNATVQAD